MTIPKISLCMITRDEEFNLSRCLESVKGAVDEIIVVDTGSTDATTRVALDFGAKVETVPWCKNFAEARNVSLSLATCEWVLYLDADETLAPGSADVLRQLSMDQTVEGYFVKVINFIGSQEGLEKCPDVIFRFFRNRPNHRFRGAIHEQIADVIREQNSQAKFELSEDFVIYHYGYMDQQIEAKNKKERNLQIIEQAITTEPDSRFLRYHYGVELFRAERYSEAVKELITAASGIDPQIIYVPKMLRYIVLCYQELGQLEAALEMVQLGLRSFPNYADLYYYGGLVLKDQQEYARAYDYLLKAAATPEQPAYFASFAGTRGFRCYYQLGMLAELFANPEEALRHYITSLRDNPQFQPALEAIIRLLEPHDDPVYARSCLEKVCDFCTPEANQLVGQMLFRQGAYRAALEYLEFSTQDQPVTPGGAICAAICLIQQRRFLEAIRLLDQIPAEHDQYPLAKLNKLLCFWFQGNTRKVRVISDELFAMGLSLETGAVIGLLAALSDRRKQLVTLGSEGMNLLLDILLRALELDENERVATVIQGLHLNCVKTNALVIARLFYRYHQWEEAERYYRLHLESDPTHAESYFMLAEIRCQQWEQAAESTDQPTLMEAETCYRQAISLDPKQPRYYVRLIQLYETIRRDLLRRAVETYPDAPVFRKLLEEVLSAP